MSWVESSTHRIWFSVEAALQERTNWDENRLLPEILREGRLVTRKKNLATWLVS